jgi:hypothetical protein
MIRELKMDWKTRANKKIAKRSNLEQQTCKISSKFWTVVRLSESNFVFCSLEIHLISWETCKIVCGKKRFSIRITPLLWTYVSCVQIGVQGVIWSADFTHIKFFLESPT